MNSWRRLTAVAIAAVAMVGCNGSTEPSSIPIGSSRFPLLTDEGGRVLSPLRLVVVAAANDDLRDSLFTFGKALATSQWWKDVSAPYRISPTATAVSVVGPAISPGTIPLAEVMAYVQRTAIDSAGFAPDGRTVYLVYLPPGVRCSGGSCDKYTAFHVPFGATDALAVITRNQPGVPPMLAMTFLGSHEVIEAATDPLFDAWRLNSSLQPWNATPWGLDDEGTFSESADLCDGTRYLEGGFFYRRVFSNQAAVLGGDPCVPALPTPYYNVTTDKGWYATVTGEVDVPITGWSVGSLGDWVAVVGAGIHTPSLSAPALSLSCADSVAIAGHRYCAINNGKRATVHVSLPAGAKSKTFFAVRIYSLLSDANGVTPAGEDFSHHWIFGVYVP